MIAITFVAAAPSRAWEVRLCGEDCVCRTEYSDTILIHEADLDAITFEDGPWYCTTLPVGPNLKTIERQAATNHWRAQLFAEPDFQAWPKDIGYDDPWPVIIDPMNPIRSLVLVGPAARLCQDADCQVFTDIVEPDLFSPSVKANIEPLLSRQEWPGRVSRYEMADGHHYYCDYCTWKLQVKDYDVVAFPYDPNAHIENPSLTSLQFYLPTATKFTIIVTAETNWFSESDPLWRDTLRVWVDTDDAAHRAGGRKFDNEYVDGEQCWAFGHDPAGTAGCKYTIGTETETDGGQPQTGKRATMRFIPSTAFPAWATTDVPAGYHTVNVGCLNDPRVYSVEVVQGVVVPQRRPLALRMYYCCWWRYGDPFEYDCPRSSNHWCMFDDVTATRSVGTMGAAGNKVIQLMAGVDRLDSEYEFHASSPPPSPPPPTMHEFSWIDSTHPTDPHLVGTEVDFAALHGEPALGNRYILRLEKNMPLGSTFEVASHANPRYDHVVTWNRPTATFAAKYFPYYRGMNVYGFMVDPYSMTARVRAELAPGAPAGTPVIVNLYCESATGTWSIVSGYENGLTIPADGSWKPFYSLSACSRVYFQVGIAAPRYDDEGEVLWLSFRGS